jgi:hypothetical protein
VEQEFFAFSHITVPELVQTVSSSNKKPAAHAFELQTCSVSLEAIHRSPDIGMDIAFNIATRNQSVLAGP